MLDREIIRWKFGDTNKQTKEEEKNLSLKSVEIINKM
jgi:hypothetical protein